MENKSISFIEYIKDSDLNFFALNEMWGIYYLAQEDFCERFLGDSSKLL